MDVTTQPPSLEKISEGFMDDWRDEYELRRAFYGCESLHVVPKEDMIVSPTERSTATTRDRLWDAHAVAGFLGLSVSWVYHRSAEGALPCMRIGGALRFDPAAIKAFARGELHGRRRVVALNSKR